MSTQTQIREAMLRQQEREYGAARRAFLEAGRRLRAEKLRLQHLIDALLRAGVAGVLLAAAGAGLAGTAPIAWDAPTTNVDGTPLVDLAGVRLYYAPVVLEYREVNGIVEWLRIVRTGPTNVVYVPAPATSVTVTNTSRVYEFWAVTVAQGGVTSAPSAAATIRVGLPTTVKLRRGK